MRSSFLKELQLRFVCIAHYLDWKIWCVTQKQKSSLLAVEKQVFTWLLLYDFIFRYGQCGTVSFTSLPADLFVVVFHVSWKL